MTVIEGRVFDARGRELGGGIELIDGTLHSVLPASTSSDIIVPGFIDLHCHGGGGASFPDTVDEQEIATAINAHLRSGTTAMLASLVSLADPLPYIAALVPFCERGELTGIHLEGPYLSVAKCGAQNPEVIRDVDLDELKSWLEAGRGHIKTMTIAPEIPGAKEAASMLLAYGAVPSWGHTSADGRAAGQALRHTSRAGARVQTVTHLFNAMPGLHHREPGPVREYLRAGVAGQAAVEIIADGYHVAPELVEDIINLDGAGRFCFVTDALAAACMPPGTYELGGLCVEVRDGACYLEGTTTLAGGASSLADQFRLFARRGQVSMATLLSCCVANPAWALGLSDHDPGVTLHFLPGTRPSFLVFNSEFTLQRVFKNGQEI